MAPGRISQRSPWLLAASALLGLIASVVNFLLPENGIDGSLGVGVVIAAMALMVLAAAATAAGYARGGLRALLLVLILLDILGSGFAAYMLDSGVLMTIMALSLLAWLSAIFAGGPSRRIASAEPAS